MDEKRIGGRVLALTRGDITRIPADAIVNAANSALAGGGGVDGAIHRAGGPAIMAELRARYPGGCPTGEAIVTAAGNLPAKWVIHAVGPRYRDGRHDEADLLASAYRAAVARANEIGARSVTLPAISAGIYGYPLEDGARIAVEWVAHALESAAPASVERATFVLFSDDAYRAFAHALATLAQEREGRQPGSGKRPSSR